MKVAVAARLPGSPSILSSLFGGLLTTSPSVRLMSLRWRQPVLVPLGPGFLDGVQIDQRAQLGPLLLDRDQ